MLKQVLVGAAALVAPLVPLSGVAGAETADGGAQNQAGLVNLNNTDALHNVDVVAGVCDNNINVLGVQVPIENVANGIQLPVASPGDQENVGATPGTCATGSVTNGGTVQD